MSEPIRIAIEDRQVLDALRALQRRAEQMRPAMAAIGELLAERTKQRFGAQAGPDGQRWAPNARTTMELYLRQVSGSYNKLSGARTGNKKGWYDKQGRVGARGAGALMSKRVLQGESRQLANTIAWRLVDGGVEVGSPMIYAGVQQFGADARAFGGKAPWGKVPPRPFLGLSTQDRDDVLAILARHLQGG